MPDIGGCANHKMFKFDFDIADIDEELGEALTTVPQNGTEESQTIKTQAYSEIPIAQLVRPAPRR
jgi:hypothetical protein